MWQTNNNQLMNVLAVVEPVQDDNLDLGAELISGRKSIRWNGDQLRHNIVVLHVVGIDVRLPGILVLYQ